MRIAGLTALLVIISVASTIAIASFITGGIGEVINKIAQSQNKRRQATLPWKLAPIERMNSGFIEQYFIHDFQHEAAIKANFSLSQAVSKSASLYQILPRKSPMFPMKYPLQYRKYLKVHPPRQVT